MPYTLSIANNNVPYTFVVNGNTVTLPYTLQDGDVIEIYRSAEITTGMLYVNENCYAENASLSVNVSDTNIVIDRALGGGLN